VGGRVDVLGSGARLGKSEYMVVEADESDRSFLKLQPTLAVVTNIDREHMDAYRDLEDVQQAFEEFANKVPFYGAAIVCVDDPATRAILPRLARRLRSYGFAPDAQVRAQDVSLEAASSSYNVSVDGRELGRFELGVPGRHNVLNSLAAIAVALELAVAPAAIQQGLRAFRGVDRRFQKKGEAKGVSVLDDYGHHPTEIKATLAVLRVFAGERRTVVLFQPHRYTRTQALWDDFAAAFAGVDVLLLADIYAASEDTIPGVSSERLAAARNRRRICRRRPGSGRAPR
jgi:UDP-N-acetylmuramate--alanine ligase